MKSTTRLLTALTKSQYSRTLRYGMIALAGFILASCSQQVKPPVTDAESVSMEKPKADPVASDAPKTGETSTVPAPQWETPEEWAALMYRTLTISQLKEQDSSGSVKQTKIRRPLTVGSVLGMDAQKCTWHGRAENG